MSDFGKNLSRLMEQHGTTASKLSKATKIPVSTISEWTAGREPRVGDPVLKIAQYFDVTLEFLIAGDKATNKHKSPPSLSLNFEEGCFLVHIKQLK